jgi:hypothetical protein
VIRTKVGRLGVAHQGGITHQIRDAAMQVCRGVIDILPVLDADEIRDLGWIIEAAIPPEHSAASRARVQQSEDQRSIARTLHVELRLDDVVGQMEI